MAEDTHEPDAEPPAGVFGNLPASRPGTRSPRRDGAEKAVSEQPKPEPAAARPEPPPAPAPPPPKPAGGNRPAQPAERGGVEDLAWAGVAVAAQAATVGVRVASRALEAVRKSIDRD